MRLIQSIQFAAIITVLLTACKKRDYNSEGLPEYAHHYYVAYLPNTNVATTVQRTQTAVLKLPVQFFSAYIRDYDAIAHYRVYTTGIANPAVLGQDFAIVDQAGNVKQPDNGMYSMLFSKAQQKTDTIYVKLLNSAVAGTRKMEIQLMEYKTDKYLVDTFSTAYTRPIEIK